MPSGVCSTNPAYTGRRETRRAISRGTLAPSEEGCGVFRPAVSCQYVTGRCVCHSGCSSRGQPREAGSLSRVPGGMGNASQCFSVGPEYYKERVRYSVQNASTSVQRGSAHCGGPRAGSGIRTGGKNSAAKRGYRAGSSTQQGVRILQPVLHRSEKRWRAASHSRSACLKSHCREAQVQDAHSQADRVTNQIRGLVCHDRSKGRLLSCIYPPSTQEVLEVRFRGRSLPISGSSVWPSTVTPHVHEVYGCSYSSAQAAGHPYSELYRRLVNSSSIGTSGGSASRCRSCSHQEVGVETQRQEECSFSITENHFSRCSVGFDDDAGTIVTCSCCFDSRRSTSSQARPVIHCKTVPETVGSHGGCVQRDTFWPPAHETVTVVAQNQRILPEGKSASHDHEFATVSSRPGYVERSLVSVPRPCVGSSLSSRNANDRCFSHGLGGDHEWSPRSGSVGGPSPSMAHKLSRDVGSVSGPETFPPGPKRPPCSCPDRQHIGGLLYQPPGGSAFSPALQAGTSDPSVVPGENSLSQSYLSPGVFESGGRHPVEAGAEARGVESSPRGGGAPMGTFRSCRGRPICVPRDITLSTVVLSQPASPTGVGCYGTSVAEVTPVRFSPDRSAPRSSGEGSPGRAQSPAYSPVLAGPSMVFGPSISPRRLSPRDTDQERSALSGEWVDPSPPSRAMEAVGLASEGAQLIDSGLSAEVVETILQSRAPSTRKLYAARWKLFTSWCGERQQDPVNCPVGTVLDFLQDRLSTGLSHSTLKVYVAALAAYHAPSSGGSLGRHPLISRFLRGTLRLRPAVRTRVPAWDLAIVLEGLSLAPFEPIEEVSEKFLTLKTILLLAISSLKRIGDIQALSVAPSCLEFAPGMVKAFLCPRPGYVPKVPTNLVGPIALQAFCPPPFLTSDQRKLNLLCPVRALDAYVHRASLWRRSEQLFVCFGSPKKGCPASKQRMSKWVVEAISLAYGSAHQPSPLAVRAHSTRSMAASTALLSGVSLQDVCDAAGWSSPHTFVRFYSLDLSSTPGAQVLSSVCVS